MPVIIKLPSPLAGALLPQLLKQGAPPHVLTYSSLYSRREFSVLYGAIKQGGW